MTYSASDFTKEVSSEEMPTSCVPIPLTCTIKKFMEDYVANTHETQKKLKGLKARLEPFEMDDDFATATVATTCTNYILNIVFSIKVL